MKIDTTIKPSNERLKMQLVNHSLINGPLDGGNYQHTSEIKPGTTIKVWFRDQEIYVLYFVSDFREAFFAGYEGVEV